MNNQPLWGTGIQELWHDASHRFRINRSRLCEFQHRNSSHGLGIKWVTAGVETYWVNGRRHRVGAGQFLMVNDQSDLAVEVRAKQPVQGMCLYVDAQAVMEAMDLMRNHGSESSSVAVEIPEQVFPTQGYALGRWLWMLGSRIDDIHHPEGLRLALTEQIAAHALRSREEQRRIEAVRPQTCVERYRRLLIGVEYAYENLSQPLRILEIAREAGLSEFHFFRAFKQAFGETPNQFLVRIRLKRAKELLRKSHHTAAEVALLCGFSDASHFGKTFRRVYGISPGQWQQRTHIVRHYHS